MVDSIGHGGGLSMLWKGDVVGQVLSSSLSHIDVEIRFPDLPIFQLIGFYGEPRRQF